MKFKALTETGGKDPQAQAPAIADAISRNAHLSVSSLEGGRRGLALDGAILGQGVRAGPACPTLGVADPSPKELLSSLLQLAGSPSLLDVVW